MLPRQGRAWLSRTVCVQCIPAKYCAKIFMRPVGLSSNALAKALHVPTPRISDIVREHHGITANTALRLARYFGGDAWTPLNLQSAHDLRIAEIANQKKIDRGIEPMGRMERQVPHA